MSHFRCPVCHGPLIDDEHSLYCERGHRFDKARSGYVNLLQSQQSSLKRHGDDKRMLKARRAFLDGGSYEPLRSLLTDTVRRTTPRGVVVDAGCGEGYYTAHIAAACPDVTVCGVDISKDALHMAASRNKQMQLAVASVFALPFADSIADTLISVFAPCADGEFARVLKAGGTLLRVIPTERHLFGLKAALYREPRLNKPERVEVDGFTLTKREELHDNLTLQTADDIRALFEMTPYFYKTGQEDQQRLLSRDTLCTEIGFAVLTYVKN